MTFIIWHLVAIVSVMAVSFIAGFWYATNSYIRQKRTVDSITNVKYNLHQRN